MTTDSVTAVEEADPRARVHAVRHRYARRGDRATVHDWAYTGYLTAILVLVYVAPVVHLVRTSRALVPLESSRAAAPVACLVAAVMVWGAQLAGRFWGPLVLKPFLLHVFSSTDLSPTHYLGPIARRRLAYAGLGTLSAVCTAAFLVTDLFDRPAATLARRAWPSWRASPPSPPWRGCGGRSGRCATTSCSPPPCRRGRGPRAARPLRRPGRGRPVARRRCRGGHGGRARPGRVPVPPHGRPRPARPRIGAGAEAQTFAWTGTLHHALDLYRPQPRGLTSALVRPTGGLRGHLTQGAVRALRTPGRALAAAGFLLTGGALLAFGVAEPGAGAATPSWVAGSLAVYWGSGWVAETWRHGATS